MKKILSIGLILALAIAIPFAFVGCKKENKASANSEVVGVWEFYDVEIQANPSYSEDDINAMYNMYQPLFENTTFEFKEDGTGVQTTALLGQVAASTFTYKAEDFGSFIEIKMTADGEEQTMYVSYHATERDTYLFLPQTSEDCEISIMFKKK